MTGAAGQSGIALEAVTDAQTIIHASSVAVGQKAALLLGASGAGKSALALQMIALGAQLIADDRTVLTLDDGVVWASAPETIRGKIEARGIGILRLDTAPSTRVIVAVDLSQREDMRLPDQRYWTLMGQDIPLLHRGDDRFFASALMVFLQSERID